MRVWLLLFIIFIYSNGLKGQICIDTIFVTYEPFELHYRIPTTKEEFDMKIPLDTICDKKKIINIISKFQKSILHKNNRVKSLDEGFKILCIIHSNNFELFRFYYTGAKKLYCNGFYFVDDFGLLKDLLTEMKADDIFYESYKNKRIKK